MERPFTLLILLLLIGQIANGQDKQPPGSLQPPMPVAEQHRNPDYAAPDSKQPDGRRRLNRPKVRSAYAVPFRISTDGNGSPMRWLIIGQQSVEINNGEPPLREPSFQMGLFGGPPMHQLFLTNGN